MEIRNPEIKQYKSKLKQFRVVHGLTQNNLSALSGVNIKSITMYEQHPEKINKASVDTVNALAQCVGCTIEDLIE